LKTIDGGISWISLATGVTDYLTNIYFINAYNGFIIGLEGTLLRTSDAGNTWQKITPPVQTTFSSIWFTDENTGFITGEITALLKTTDGGLTWNQVPVASGYRSLNSLVFTGPSTGYQVGSFGRIEKTSDGGLTWESQVSGTLETLNSVWFPSVNTGYAVGEKGIILKTTNGGGTWIKEFEKNSCLDIHPNPARDVIQIEVPCSKSHAGTLIMVFGSTGTELIKRPVLGMDAQLDISQLPVGIYFVALYLDGYIMTGKFVKQ
jgi:photosystem II stability/assembly factor-like uncharacterized protein